MLRLKRINTFVKQYKKDNTMAIVSEAVVHENYTNYVQMHDNEEYLKPLFNSESKFIIDRIEFGECGYERKSDWMRLINKVDNYNADALFKKMLPSLKGEYTVKYHLGEVEINYLKPIKVVIAEIGFDYVVEEVIQIKGNIHWEWYTSGSKSTLISDYCNVLEVGLTDVEYNYK